MAHTAVVHHLVLAPLEPGIADHIWSMEEIAGLLNKLVA